MASSPDGVRLPAAWNYGAVERALRDARGRGDRSIFEPVVGKVFDSTQEGYEFYNMFSWEVGFGIRYGRSRKSSSGRRTRQDLVCACEGHDASADARSVRTGCPAMIRLLRKEDDSWFISRHICEHNHPLSISCGERKQWNSHCRIDQMTRDLVRNLRNNNVQISRVCSILGNIHGGNNYVPFTRQSIRSLCGRLAQESIEGDLGKTMEVFNSMRRKDPSMVLRMQVDPENRVKSLFWCHGSSKFNYQCFGDAITFDTTYRTNLYNLPFGLFVGVNNHFQSCIFGAVLLTEETTSAFQWAFRTFIEAMDGVTPKTILTDQCQSMRAAIASELPSTRHRWCKWHVLKKAKESLGAIYSKNYGFKRDLHELLDEIVLVQEFELRWSELIDRYGLGENQFLDRAFENRRMWAKPYFTDTFCAGMTSTQRSESANHLLKTYIPRAAPMHLFVSQYNRMIADREADEAREEHATRQIARALRVGVPLELHASRLYTRAMYDRFSKELFKSGSFTCYPTEGEGQYIVSINLDSDHMDNGAVEFRVGCSPDGKDFFCECKKFEHSGIPCRHIIKVLVHYGYKEVPAGLVLRRWTRNAKDTGNTEAALEVACQTHREIDSSSMHTLAYSAAMELVGLACTSRQAFEIGLDFVSRAKQAITSLTVVDEPSPASTVVSEPAPSQVTVSHPANVSVEQMAGVSAPPRVRSRGRPVQTRFKSPIESPGATKRKRAVEAGASSTRKSVRLTDKAKKSSATRTALCRVCGGHGHYASKCPKNMVSAENEKTSRLCKACGEAGHYRTTCGRKSTYTAA